MLMWLTLIVGIGEPQLAARLARVQEAYRQGGAMSARFTQTYRDALRPGTAAQQERGVFFIDTDGKVRLRYLAPEHKEFFFDGTTAYLYQPQEAQVTVFPSFEDSLVAASIQVLWGHGQIDALHTIEACAGLSPSAAQAPALGGDAAGPPPSGIPAGELCVQLRPKVADPQVAWVRLGLDEAKKRLNRFVIIDGMGNATEYAFDDIRLKQRLDPALFRFVVPEGVTRLDARAAP